jgi:hypothetical protein
MNAPSAAGDECTEYLRAFLRSLLTVAHEQSKIFFPTLKQFSYASMAKRFYDFFAERESRRHFYLKVVASSNPNSERIEEITAPFRVLQRYLSKRCTDWPTKSKFCPFIISMDEIHVLYNPRNMEVQSPYTLYARLKSALRGGTSADLCAIFLTTATSVNKIAPSKDVAPSYRERESERFLPAPFTELPFDPFVISDPLVPKQLGLDDVGSLAFTAKFGRPMYVDLIRMACLRNIVIL